MHKNKAIAITQGDSAGIGPEIIAKVFREQPALLQGCFVVGDVATMRRGAQAIAVAGETSLPVAVIASPDEAWQVPPRCIPVLELPDMPPPAPWGQITDSAGAAAAACVQWAARAALRGEIAALVTAPLHKEALHAGGVTYPGHTELLQAEAAQHAGVAMSEMPVRMMLANDELCTVLVSIHVSLRKALEAVTLDNILQTLQITHAALQGEGGLFGSEEIDIIAPAIAAARAQGIDAQGPFAPDTVFMRARNVPGHPGEFDVVLAMYHDQGLIPIKYLGVESGVNVTLGLPLVRTSPDHGTAFDIAGQGVADASSLLEAVRMAQKLSASARVQA